MLKNILVVVSYICFFSETQAGELTDKVIYCAKIKDDLKRLYCYDNIANTSLVIEKHIESIYKVPQNAIKEPATAQETKFITNNPTENNFGLHHLKKLNKIENVEQIVLTIANLKKDVYQKWILTFDNGQIWKQKDSTSLLLTAGDSVQLSLGALGAIYLKKIANNKRIKVNRIK